MITVEEAKEKLVNSIIKTSNTISMPVEKALGEILAENIYSPYNLPFFNQSNVDGYAICMDDHSENNAFKIIGEIKAGDESSIHLTPGFVARIFTGAMVPKGANAVIMQEFVNREKDEITFDLEHKPTIGQQIRKEGSQIKKGELAIPKNKELNLASVSFLNMLGFNKVSVFKKPNISIVITGNELQKSGTRLESGKVFECNSSILFAALEAMKIKVNSIEFIKDEKQEVKNALEKTLDSCDFLLVSGGISVGDYDFVKEVLEELRVETIFYKVAQKPGKPLFFGKLNTTYVFALPGNPASVLTCFYEYIYPAINLFYGKQTTFLKIGKAILENKINKKAGLAHFLKANTINSKVTALDGQESFILKSFSEANSLIYLPSSIENVEKGEEVEIHYLPM